MKLQVRQSINVTKSNEDHIFELDNFVKKHSKELVIRTMYDEDFEKLAHFPVDPNPPVPLFVSKRLSASSNFDW